MDGDDGASDEHEDEAIVEIIGDDDEQHVEDLAFTSSMAILI